MSNLGKVLAIISTLFLAHSAYSTYERSYTRQRLYTLCAWFQYRETHWGILRSCLPESCWSDRGKPTYRSTLFYSNIVYLWLMNNVWFVIDHCGMCCISIRYLGWRYHLGSTFQEHSLVRSHGNHVCIKSLLNRLLSFLFIGYMFIGRLIKSIPPHPLSHSTIAMSCRLRHSWIGNCSIIYLCTIIKWQQCLLHLMSQWMMFGGIHARSYGNTMDTAEWMNVVASPVIKVFHCYHPYVMGRKIQGWMYDIQRDSSNWRFPLSLYTFQSPGVSLSFYIPPPNSQPTMAQSSPASVIQFLHIIQNLKVS